MAKGTQYTKEQAAAIAWLEALEKSIRVAKSAISLSRYEPEKWTETAGFLFVEIKETAAAGPAGHSPETAIAIQWSKDDGLINSIRDDGQPVELEAENWRSALLEFAPALAAGGWRDLMLAAWGRIDWIKVVEAGRGDHGHGDKSN